MTAPWGSVALLLVAIGAPGGWMVVGCAGEPNVGLRDVNGLVRRAAPAAEAACGWTWPASRLDEDTRVAQGLTDPCIGHLLADMHAGGPGFDTIDRLAAFNRLESSDNDEEMPPEPVRQPTPLLVEGLATLLRLDLGAVDLLEASSGISSRFVALVRDVAATTGETRVGPALYDLVVSAITETASGQGAYTGPLYLFVAPNTTRLVVRPHKTDGTTTAAMLVHMATHALGLQHSRCGWLSGTTNCDADFSGAHGAQLAVLVLAWRHAPDPDARERLGARAASTVFPYVRTCLDEHLRLKPEWGATRVDLSSL